MNNKYRLSSAAFEREKEEDKVEIEKIFFFSVEGNITEVEYLKGISDHREYLEMSGRIDIKVLERNRRDTNSAPEQVIELLEEYIELRKLGKEGLLEDVPEEFTKKYGIEFVEHYLEDPQTIPKKKRNIFETDLRKIGYNINYRKYLHDYNRELDEFCILIDRDETTHSEINMLECIRYCQEKNYRCYIANPCFEFWLLLHLSDVEKEYHDKMDLLKKNPIVSARHTFVSKEVSRKAHHGKGMIHFVQNYLPHVDTAIQRAKRMAGTEKELLENIGCNLWKLLEEMKENN